MNSNNEFEVARLQTKKIGQVAWPLIDKKILFSQRMALQKKKIHTQLVDINVSKIKMESWS